MKFNVSILIFFFVVNYINSSQLHKTDKYGTTIVFAEGTDGIVIAADSRITNYLDNEKKIINYYRDSAQKIFFIHGYPLAISGLYGLEGKEWSQIVKEFNQFNLAKTDCFSIFGQFLSFVQEYYPSSKQPPAKTNGYYCVGYKKDTAYMLAYNGNDSGTIRHISIFDSCGASTDFAGKIIKKKYKKVSCDSLSTLLVETIKESYVREGTGGPITVVRLLKNNMAIVLQNDFSKKPEGETTKHYLTPKE